MWEGRVRGVGHAVRGDVPIAGRVRVGHLGEDEERERKGSGKGQPQLDEDRKNDGQLFGFVCHFTYCRPRAYLVSVCMQLHFRSLWCGPAGIKLQIIRPIYYSNYSDFKNYPASWNSESCIEPIPT